MRHRHIFLSRPEHSVPNRKRAFRPQQVFRRVPVLSTYVDRLRSYAGLSACKPQLLEECICLRKSQLKAVGHPSNQVDLRSCKLRAITHRHRDPLPIHCSAIPDLRDLGQTRHLCLPLYLAFESPHPQQKGKSSIRHQAYPVSLAQGCSSSAALTPGSSVDVALNLRKS